jgi:DNA-binding transcriptional MocR family regulator
MVSSGNKYFAQSNEYAHFRISIAKPEVDEIIEGFEKIRQAITGLLK